MNDFMRKALEEAGVIEPVSTTTATATDGPGEVEVKGPLGAVFSEALAKAYPIDPKEQTGVADTNGGVQGGDEVAGAVATEAFVGRIKRAALESEAESVEQNALMRVAAGINETVQSAEPTGDMTVYVTSPETISQDDITAVSNDLVNREEDAGDYIVVVDATEPEAVDAASADAQQAAADPAAQRMETALEALTVSLGGKFIRVK